MSVEGVSISPVRTAIATAARATGQDFGFLLATAVRESSLDPSAEARTSSATGLFQFIDQTWLATVRRHGGRHGMGAEAALIDQGADGVFRVGDPDARRRILDMRYDPELSARMAGELANDNADFIRVRAGVEPQFGDLYAAHFLGPAGASELIVAARERPWASAADLFPQAARANRPVFYERDGRPRTVVEVLDNLRATAGREIPDVSAREYMLASRARPGAETGFARWPDFAARAATDARLAGAMTAPLANDSATLRLISGSLAGDDAAGPGGGMFDPAMLAQVYGAEAAQAEAATAQAIGAILSTGSIARALSPSGDTRSNSSAGSSLASPASATPPESPQASNWLRGRN